MKDLNLIPRSYILEKRKRIKRFYNILAISGIVIVIACMVIFPLGMRYKLILQKNALDRQVKETNNYVAIEKQMNTVQELYKLREDEGNKLEESGIDVKSVFEGIEKALPEKLFITSFGVGNNAGASQVTLSGIASSEDDIATFVKYMREDGHFKNVLVSGLNKMQAQSPAASVGSVLAGEAVNPANPGTAGVNIQGKISYSFNIIIYLKAGK